MPEKDSSFIDLTKKLNSINIDDRLKPAFIEAMKRFQKYFNEKGYTSERNFNAFFEEYIFNADPSKNLKMIVSDEPVKTGAMGFYRFGKEEIHVDEQFLEKPEIVTHIVIHEFIHFLTMHEQAKGDRIPDFMNEGITEKLAREVSGLKEVGSYEPQVQMMDFLNKLRGENYNFRNFITQGRIDSKLLFFGSFNSESKLFQDKYNQHAMSLLAAKEDDNYIKAQRSLVYDTLTTAKDIEKYKRIVETLASRPVRDDEFVNQALERTERYLINSECMSFSKNNPDHQMMQTFMANKVKELRDKLTILGQIDPKTPFEFIKDLASGANIILKKEDGQLKWNIQNWQGISQMNTSQNKIEIAWGPKYPYAYKVSLDTDKLAFDGREKLSKEVEEISKMFGERAKSDQSKVMKCIDDKSIVSCDRHDISTDVEGKTSTKTIYTTKDKEGNITVDRNYIPLKKIREFDNHKLIGYIPSNDEKTGLTWLEPKGKAQNGQVYTLETYEMLQRKAKLEYGESLTKDYTEEQFQKLVEDYKKSEYYDPEFDESLSPERLMDVAVDHFYENEYSKLDLIEQNKRLFKQIEKSPKMIVYEENGIIRVGNYNEEFNYAVQNIDENLIDLENEDRGLYTKVFKDMQQEKDKRQQETETDSKDPKAILKSKYDKERITKEDLKMLGNMFKSQYQGKQKEESKDRND